MNTNYDILVGCELLILMSQESTLL